MVDTYMYIQKTGFEWKQNKLYMYIPNNKETYVFACLETGEKTSKLVL